MKTPNHITSTTPCWIVHHLRGAQKIGQNTVRRWAFPVSQLPFWLGPVQSRSSWRLAPPTQTQAVSVCRPHQTAGVFSTSSHLEVASLDPSVDAEMILPSFAKPARSSVEFTHGSRANEISVTNALVSS